jgi:hypothetical protein
LYVAFKTSDSGLEAQVCVAHKGLQQHRQFYTPSNIGENGLKNLTFLFVTAV